MKIGNKIKLKVFDKKIVPHSFEKGEIQEFEIIGKNLIGDVEYYLVLLSNDFIGWYISEFHIEHQSVNKKHLNAKFWEISEFYHDIQ